MSAAKFLLFPAGQPHNAYIKLFCSKILCSMLVGQPAGKIGIGSVSTAGEMWIVSAQRVLRCPTLVCDDLHSVCGKNRQPVRVKRCFLPCKPTDPFPNVRGQVPAFSRRTATQCLHQALLQQNPVQYARRRVCGKNRDRFRLKKLFCLSCKSTNLNRNLLQQT